MSDPTFYVATGHVVDVDAHEPVEGLFVEAYDRDQFTDNDLLGGFATGDGGVKADPLSYLVANPCFTPEGRLRTETIRRTSGLPTWSPTGRVSGLLRRCRNRR